MPVVVDPSAIADGNKAIVLWSNLLVDADISAAGEADGYPAINVTDPATFDSWKGATAGDYIEADLGAAMAVNTLGIAAHTLGTSGASLELDYSDDGAAWTAAVEYDPLTDEDVIIMFGNITARYWRLTVTDAVANVGVVFLGARLVFPHTPVDGYTPLHHARRYSKLFNDSLKGQMLGNRVMAAGAETTVDLGFVERSFVDGPLRGFEDHYNRGGTFFYAGYPSGKPLDMGYCRAQGEDDIVTVEYIEADKLSNLSFTVRAYVGT